MYPAKFDYYRASSLDDALRLLGEHPDAKLLAGGHSLLPMMKLRLAQPATLVDIGRVDGLSGVSRENGRVRVGALTTHAEMAASDVLQQHCPLLAEAAAQVGDPQVRNRGTLGGNLAHADPASDLPGVVRALGGVIHTKGKGGERQVSADDFFVDLLTSDLKDDEILTAVELPAAAGKTGSCYLKFEHPASGYAVVGAAATVTLGGDGKCQSAALCFNGVTATPLKADAVTASLTGKSLSDEAIDQAVSNLKVDDPLGDVYASGPYRAHLAQVYGRRALKAARDRAQ